MSAAACSEGRPKPPPEEEPSFPVIVRFEADATTVDRDGTVTFTYEATKATSVEIDHGVLASTPDLAGTVTTPPIVETTSFTLRAKSASGETTRTQVITVRPGNGVEIMSFDVDPKVIAPGETARLTWTVFDATRVQLSIAGGAVLQADAESIGALDVQPLERTVYALVAEGLNGPVTKQVAVLVGFEPQILTFEAVPAQITVGQSATLMWNVENAETIQIRDENGATILGNAPAMGSLTVSPMASTAYELIASSEGGDAVGRVDLEVLPAGSARIVAFTVTPTDLPAPGQVSVHWETADADTIDLLLDGVSVPSFPRTESGDLSLQVPVSGTLRLLVENEVGMASQEVMITVGIPDTTPPVITHVPIAAGQLENTAIDIGATIVDGESGVASATLFYRTIGQATFSSMGMPTTGNDRYVAQLPASAVVTPGIEYYLHAADGAMLVNNATDPSTAPGVVHSFSVIAPDTTAPSITHTPIANDQAEGVAINIAATVTDASGIASVQLFFKARPDSTYTALSMTAGANNTYTAQLPGTAVVPAGVDYYLEASDNAAPSNMARSPATAPATPNSFTVIARDVTAPSIVHTRIANGQTAGQAVTVNADVSDASGVAAVTLYYRTTGAASFSSVAMNGAGSRTAQIPAVTVASPSVEYYIEANDTAAPANIGRLPTTAPGTPYTFTVTPADTAPPTITHTPIIDGQAPNAAVNVSATVSDGSGVASVTLFYRPIGAASYSQVAMSGGPVYTGAIPGSSVGSVGVEYYLRAIDSSVAANAAVLPATAPGTGYRFTAGGAEVEPNGTAATASPLLGPGVLTNIGLGAISPIADRDFWIIDVPVGSDRYTINLDLTAGGPGACASPIATVITVYATDGTTVLVSDSTDGVGNCSRIDPATDAAARALATGRYYVRVEESGNNATVSQYELRASMSVAVCANNILELATGEQCDDGNTNNGDGCSSTCRFEPEGTANPPGAVFSGDISPAGDSDLYAVVVGQGQFLRAEISNGSGGCPGDTVLELYDTTGNTLIGSDDNDGSGNCSLINPLTDTWAANMAAGTYFLRVRAFSATTMITGYSLDVDVTTNLCGNGALETGETCDDGDTTSNDGCSSSCVLELQATITGMGGSYTQSIDPIGNIDWYAVTVPQGASLRIETFSPADGMCAGSVDTVIRLYQSDRTTQVATDDEGGISSCSLLDPVLDTDVRNLAAGTYYVTVEEWQNNGLISAYVLDVEIRMPACGDGFVNGSETCDDGNILPGDGCSAMCAYEGPAELEPNNTRPTATPFLTAGNTQGRMIASMSSSSDVDVFSIVVPAGGGHVIGEITNGRDGCPAALSLRMRNSAGTSLATDSTDGPESCGRITPGGDTAARNLAAGTYYLEVTGAQVPTYILDARVVANGCGDTYLVAGETCDDGNTTAGDGCSATCQLELMELEPNNTSSTATPLMGTPRFIGGRISVAGEADWYSVSVAQGGSIHVAVHNGGVDQCGSIDPDIEVFAPNGTTSLGQDDYDGQGNCAVLYRYELMNLNAGLHYLKVDGFDPADVFDYVLSVSVY